MKKPKYNVLYSYNTSHIPPENNVVTSTTFYQLHQFDTKLSQYVLSYLE